jgi:hypothetical protein
MTNDFSEDNIPQSNWMTFVNVGDIVKGTLVEKYIKEGTD